MSESLNIILNGKKVDGIKNETILQLASRHGITIPTLCNDPRLEPYSSCYVCVVEVDGMNNMQPSCSTLLSEGMAIHTDNEKTRKARKAALDLLASNHYADCIGPCKQTCPAGVDVQGYISMIEKGKYSEAVAIIKETNPLPAVCGRVCVRPCEIACRRNLLDEGAAVGIDYLKRFASDRDLESGKKYKPAIKPATGKKVAIIGGGPAGLSAAFFLRKEGHEAEIFEGAPKAGGWLRYGIPEYRLPNDLLQKEIDNITEMGARIHYNQRLGQNLSYNTLKDDFDAVILAIGSQKGTRVGCEGDDAGNVLSGIDFLKQMELTGEKMDFSNKVVAVVGGGNTAMDCCRTAQRCGAKKVYVIYRRTEKEMPANPIEIHESKLEGVEYLLLTNPKRINKNEQGNLKSVTCLRMELGEPDASGRRRPVPVEGSDFEIELDYMLAAIGQKTEVSFIDNINTNCEIGQLNVNKWGDIEADRHTLQTGIPSVFAAGDGVTGPATLIEAIAQARIASHSCHLYLSGLCVKPMPTEFLSKKDNFKEQHPADYIGKFTHQLRREMPTIPADERANFREVELGYENEEVAIAESQRCLECGCTEYFTCNLKALCTEYEAEQKRYEGEFKLHEIDFRHPYIEIDNNKCILCSRCVRICQQVVGASALGLINRGFDTYVAPSMELPLQETTCESCGLCISACPTGAITENTPFKPGPVKTEKSGTICNFCSVGCSIHIHHRNGFVMSVTGNEGLVNKDGNICRFAKFGYRFMNDPKRITKPLLKKNSRFEPVGFEEAYDLIAAKIKSAFPDDNIFYAGARLTNEELYLIQKLARAGAKTNNVSSFHYLGRGGGYTFNSLANAPLDELEGVSRFILLGSEINNDNAVVGFILNNIRFRQDASIEVITTNNNSSMAYKADKLLKIKSYYHFLKAVNHYLLNLNLENGWFIRDNCDGFEEYRKALLAEDFIEILSEAGIKNENALIQWAIDYNNELNAVVVFSEKELSGRASQELFNLAMITGKLGKTSNGLLSIKEKNNSQGLFDMGIHPSLGPGTGSIEDPHYRKALESLWKIAGLPEKHSCTLEKFKTGSHKNVFIFGEDPLGCAINPDDTKHYLDGADFVVVQDYFLTPTTEKAHLILPATLPSETGGSFANTQKMIQHFDAVMPSKVEQPSWEQLTSILERFGINGISSPADVLNEIFSVLPEVDKPQCFTFRYTEKDNSNRMFDYGCDSVCRRFEDEFANALCR
ncbi:MAG: FAD-dependent oxidoreductase [Bacteroidales bacterium]|nr:FAD-dependent oxidoreductase [Bacteroidales bacterium]MDZ4203438.1 FAD-dependent oxidoreductase [Bacteroidales bacterium]